MASLHRDPRSPKGVWYCAYILADGRRAFRSTGKRNKAHAKIVCDALAQAETEAASGELSKDRLTELFNETLHRIGESPLERISVGDWLKSWLASKENAAPATFAAYTQAIEEFLEFLGSRGRQSPAGVDHGTRHRELYSALAQRGARPGHHQ